jgi:4-amino-4-deoxy-L-arabinose transferase-like glycosyltransferase
MNANRTFPGRSFLPWLVGLLLATQAVLVAAMAEQYAPTTDEPVYLIAGISHLELGRYELCRVCPPLVRMVAAVPVYLSRPVTDWSRIDGRPGSRSEWNVARQFLRNNGQGVFWLFTLGRWACLPFILCGGYVCSRWAYELYGAASGLLALALWCFSPNVLAHAALLTPDAATAALAVLAGYAFWRWLRAPGWSGAALAGLALGLAQLAKTSLVVLLPLWPVIWLAWQAGSRPAAWRTRTREIAQVGVTLALALLVLNAGYEFTGSLRSLGSYRFVSRMLAGTETGTEGNRFASTWLASLPVPLPEDYLLGIDTQRVSFEVKGRSYLHGEWKVGGWWYYYLYGLAVKVPLGTLILLGLAFLVTLVHPQSNAGWRNEMVLLLPALSLFIFVSSQTGFSRHFKYVLPPFPFVFIGISKVAQPDLLKNKLVLGMATLSLAWAVTSSLLVYPYSLSYFNELAGGPKHGQEHLLLSNMDWGQDLLYLKRWLEDHPEARPLQLAYYGIVDPASAGIAYTPPPPWPVLDSWRADHPSEQPGPHPGWFAVSANYLCGHYFPMHNGQGQEVSLGKPAFTYFQRFRPVARAGYSILIYHISVEEANRIRRELGLPELNASAAEPLSERWA